jgi:predicted outer membrane repeat protein
MRKTLLSFIVLICAVAQSTWGQTLVKNEAELAQAVKTHGANIVMLNDIEISMPVLIQGDNGGGVTVSINMNQKKLSYKTAVGQNSASCVFAVPAGSTLNLSNGSIADVDNRSGKNTVYVAGGIVNDGTTTLDGVTISGCKGLYGGAIKNNDKATLNLISCIFDSNEAAADNDFSGSGNGGAIWNDGTITIKDTQIKNCDAVNGAGIYNGANGRISLASGSTKNTSFYKNKAGSYGGAIYNLGSLDLSMMTFSTNSASQAAGAIWNGKAMTLRGCEFLLNQAQNGGAVYISSDVKNNASITGGSTSKNIAGNNGGFVYCDGVLAMDAITFEGNKAGNNTTPGNGGAVYISTTGEITITDNNDIGNTIKNNSASLNGGAIYTNGKLTMGGITASANTADAGGMLYIDGNGSVTVNTKTSLSENKSNKLGGAIYDAGTLAVNGKISVKNNTGADDAANNVYLASGKVMDVTGSLAASSIGVILADTTGVFTSGFNNTNSGVAPGTFFTPDCYPEFYGVTLADNEAKLALQSPIVIGDEATLRKALSMFDNFSIKLSADINITNSTLEIPANKTVTIDLGGFTMDRGLKSREWNTGGQVITVREGATLNLSNGTLTGGWGGNAGGLVNEKGTANLTDVIITGCVGDDRGGGISNKGTLTMTGGSLTNNTSYDAMDPKGGGGLFNYKDATATLTGVSITGNKADKYGGAGVCNYGTLTIDGCTITGNTCKTNGGAIWNYSQATLTMKGKNTVTDNTGGEKTDNVYLPDGFVININGSLADSNIGVNLEKSIGTFTSGYKTNNADVDPATVFKADNAVVFVPVLSGDEAALTLKPLISVDNDADLRTAVDFDGANIQLVDNIKMSNSTLVTGGGKTVTIDLNGKTLDRGLTSRDFDHGGQVITVRKGGTLNLSNGTLTGGYGGNGGGLVNEGGSATLTDVNITGCKADQRGGGISNYGTLTMTGGSITGNTSNDIMASDTDLVGGGGINTSKGSTTTLTGVTITGNQAKDAGGGGVNNWGTVTLDGCTITGNTSKANGGGIWNGPGSTINMQGKNTVTDNQGEGNVNNVYLRDGVVITVTGSLEGSKIGVRMASPGVFTSGYSANNDKAPITYFVPDNSDYQIVLSDNEARLQKKMGDSIQGIDADEQGSFSNKTGEDGTCYDLSGRKVNSKSVKGIYIVNGKKVLK